MLRLPFYGFVVTLCVVPMLFGRHCAMVVPSALSTGTRWLGTFVLSVRPVPARVVCLG